MRNKLTLNTNIIVESFFEDAHLFGIVSTIKDYKLCWYINKQLGYNFRLCTDINVCITRSNRQYEFKIFEFIEPVLHQSHYIYNNLNDGEYLLPELKNFDFIWLVKADYFEEDLKETFTKLLNSLPEIRLAQVVDTHLLKNKKNLIF
jgi:hypothetical protein